jgi:hypothetical protein
LSRANKINRLHNIDYGTEVRHRGGGLGGFGFDEDDRDELLRQPQSPTYDYNDDNREMSVNFYDNKYYDPMKMHR